MSPTEDHAYKIAREWLYLHYGNWNMTQREKNQIDSLAERIRTYGREAALDAAKEERERAAAAVKNTTLPTMTGTANGNPWEFQAKGFYIGLRMAERAIRQGSPK